MGCVIGKVAPPGIVHRFLEEKRDAENYGKKSNNASVRNNDAGDELAEKVDGGRKGDEEHEGNPKGERRKLTSDPRSGRIPKQKLGEQVAAGWPTWLSAHVGEVIDGWLPRRADTFEKIDKIGQGTYSNVYKAKDTITGKIVALKKVRFDNLEPESVRFMSREIIILRRLNHPNVIKLEGLATSRMSCSLYLVFEYMEHDLAGLAASPEIKFTESQVKCYIHQLLSGLEHCHERHVLHRDIKGSNLLIDNEGVLRIADFGLATVFDPKHKHPMTNRVVTLWYRPPELLLGATYYNEGIDLWSAGCILAELFAGKAVMAGQTEIEQLHKIYKLCGSPSEEYWKRYKFPNATLFKPREPFKRCTRVIFKDFPSSSLPLIDSLLAIDPAERKTATDALRSEFFTTEPYACDPASLPKYPPTKEMDAKRRDVEARRLRAANKSQVDGAKKPRRERPARAIPALNANAELQTNIDQRRRRLISQANAKSKSEKFPPPHQDGGVGVPLGISHRIDLALVPHDVPFSSTSFRYSKEPVENWSGPLVNHSASSGRQKKQSRREDKR